MGSSFKRAIFEEHIQEGLVGWAKQAKKKTVLRKAADESSHNDANQEIEAEQEINANQEIPTVT